MRLVSMQNRGENLSQHRAGLLVGDEVLDITDFCEILEEKGEWIESEAPLPSYHHLEGAYQDAMDLYNRGIAWLKCVVSRLEGDPLIVEECRELAALIPCRAAKLNAPVLRPGKILAIGLNYTAHARETGAELPQFPLLFSKSTSALIGPGDPIRIPRISEKIDYEAELAFVIGKEARSVSAKDALEYVAGYTIMNDVSARDIQRRERQWVRAKGLDTFAPCGPWLVTGDEIPDPHSLQLELRLNGAVHQSSSTNDMIFKIPELIEFISQDLTLLPGDIVTTGTPSGVGYTRQPPVFLKDGDLVEIRIEGLGTLENPVIGPER
jgi:2-keto-4-pentenoate hydratase/2-oxohepta-3-ene-1,7-dioic acid hydratase in catechol pathway